MISPPAPSSTPSMPSVSRTVSRAVSRAALDTLPRTMRQASVIAAAVLLGSVLVTALVGIYLLTHALIFPAPAIQVSFVSHATTIHPSDKVQFSVTAASGRQLTYRWSFGDGATASGTNVTHQYATYGYYAVTATATDPTGQAASSQVVVTVLPPAPQAHATVKYDRTYSYVVTLDASGSTGADLHYYWDFGDGSPGISGLEPQTTHYYQHPGVFGASLTVIDVVGQTSTTTVQVTVSAASFH